MKRPKTARDTAKIVKNTPAARVERTLVVVDPVDGVIREHKLNEDATKTVGLPKKLLDLPQTREFIKGVFKKT